MDLKDKVLAHAAMNGRLETASAFRVLIVIAPQLDIADFRPVAQVALVLATNLHVNRVRHGLKQLLVSGILERRVARNGDIAEYKFGPRALPKP